MPTAISTQCTVSSALRDCGGLLNSTVPQVLVLFRFQASSHSGESGCTDNKFFGRACFIEERKYGREVVRLYSLGVHFAQFRAFVVRSAQMVGTPTCNFARAQAAPPQCSVPTTTNSLQAASDPLETIISISQRECGY